jgi:hypothetical protein
VQVGVREQVLEDPLHLRLIDVRATFALFDLDRPVAEDLRLGEETSDELVQLERVPARRHDARIQAVEVEQIRQQRVHPLRSLDERSEHVVANLIVQLVPQPFERAGGDQDGRERRLEVVRERVEQRVLEPVERDQSLLLGPALGDVEQQALQADRMAVRVEHSGV